MGGGRETATEPVAREKTNKTFWLRRAAVNRGLLSREASVLS